MQEFWFCANCKSMNRGADRQCYKCRALKEQATMATVATRQEDVVLTPGLDEEHREVAWQLMYRQRYISAWKLGYVAAGMILVMLGLGLLGTILAGAELARNGFDFTAVGRQGPVLGLVLLVLTPVTLLTVVVHSAFLCLTTMNTPALGSGSPRFDPIRAAVWWIESALWAIRAGLAFVLPPLFCLIGLALGGFIFGIAIGVVWAVCIFWLFGDPIGCLGKPKRLLTDLWDRLAVPGSPDSRMVTLWSVAWATGRGVEYAVFGFAFIAVIVLAFLALAGAIVGFRLEPASQSQYQLMAALLTVLIGGVQVIADGLGLFLLAQITLELSKRQRQREAWVLGGLDSARTKAALAGAPAGPASGSAAFQGQFSSMGSRPAPAGSAAPAFAAAPAGPSAQWTPVSAPVSAPASAPVSAPISAPVTLPPPVTPPPPGGSAVETSGLDAPRPSALEIPEAGTPPPPVIRPSSASLSRYRAPLGGTVPPPANRAADDLDFGGGI